MKINDVLTKLFNNEIKVDEAAEEFGRRLAESRRERLAAWWYSYFKGPLDVMFGIMQLAVALFVSGLLGLVACAGWAAMMSSGAVDYCYLNSWGETITREDGSKSQSTLTGLYGHRPYRDDKLLGVHKTFDDAVAAAQKLGCPFKR